MSRISAALAALALLVAAIVATQRPERAEAQFSQQGLVAYSVGGTANAVTLSVYNMSVLVKGVPFSFVPSSTNTGPTTINVNGIGAVNVKRPSSVGIVASGGGELLSGVLTTVMYDGTNINVVYPVNMDPPGAILELRANAATSAAGITPPPGYLVEDGSCVSQTTYAALYAVTTTSYGSCSAGLFAVPDSRGTTVAAADNQGANGSAGRITSGGSGCNALYPGVLCGSQLHTLTVGELPAHTHGYSGNTGTESATHYHNVYGTSGTMNSNTTHYHNYVSWGSAAVQAGVGSTVNSGTGSVTNVSTTNTDHTHTINLNSATESASHTHAYSGTTDSGTGGGASHPVLNPILTAIRLIKT